MILYIFGERCLRIVQRERGGVWPIPAHPPRRKTPCREEPCDFPENLQGIWHFFVAIIGNSNGMDQKGALAVCRMVCAVENSPLDRHGER